ncbi:MAG: hypothetical protein IT467_03390 [Dokdonella sp.]|uniref:InlB B-repeat-containing protein n=1 Tax=Dokdonella sp. TaxID=2291710 RepID=UPI0025BB95AA|nr:choice-of-anchor Q domain-containing protein [Dokdonella sp.]MBZ0223842.1 hypothetical protein [Dokdonella sp.]MCC7254956.1 hypothetical protein [Dokdonella sp.]
MTCTSRLLRNLLLGALLLGMPLVQAGEVTSLAASGSGSLRDVVAGGGTVTFASGLSGTIDLAGSSITVPGGTTIQGPGARSLAVQGGSGRAFVVSAGSTVSISGLTISASNAGAGQTGGAINNAGALTLADMVFASNSAGDAGGAVFNSGQLVIRRSLFNANQITDTTCASGGAVRSQGAGSSLTIENSTFTGNSAPSCSGGGVGFNNGGATITSSTFTANSAGASGGNLYKGSNAAPLTLTATVIADGSAPTNADLHGAMGGFTSGGYNLVRARGDSTGYVGSDLANGTDPALGALGDHGGPSNSRLPQAGSPLLDAFTSGCTGTDQRGVARPQGASCDIGAVEYRLDPLTVQITGNGTVSAGATPAPVSGSIANCAGTCTATYDGEGATPASVTLTATPGVGYQLSGWGGACSGSSPSTVVAMGAARTCTASFELTVATITPSVIGGHGTISPDTPQQVNIGDTLQFTLTPETNYHVASVGGSCGGTLNGNVYTTAAVNADCSVEAHFAIDQYTVTPSVIGGHGTISPDTAQQVDHGATIQFTLAPETNYHVANVGGSCGGSLNGNVYTTAVVTGNCSVEAHFAIDQHTVTPSVIGGHGTISPNTAQLVDHGATIAFTLAPEANYHVANVGGSCGGTLNGNVYTTAAVNADCSVEAHFAIDQHTVTPSVIGGHGTISPDTAQQVDHGSTLQFTLAPDANYHIASVGGSCGGSLNGTVYTTSAVNADCSVEAHFAIDQHTVTPSVIGGHGTISPDTAQQVDHGATIQFTLAADPHYHLVNVDGSCDGSLNGNLYTTAAVTGDCTVQAHFAIDTYTIGGTVSGLIGSALVLKLNGGQDLLITGNGAFTFASAIDDLSAWTVTVAQQPVSPTQRCTVSNGSGTLDGANVNNVQVQCETPVPHLVVSVTDSREYARYGMLLDYVVTLTNDGSGDATGITVQGLPSDQLDATAMSWVCYGADASAHCSASGSGAFSDTAVDLPIGRTLTWLVSAPVRNDAPGPSADFTIEAGMGASASDSDILVLLRTGFDVPYGDGAERAGEGSACHAPLVGSAVLGARSTYAFELPAAASTPIDVVLVARAVDGSGFRVERLNLGSPRLRLVASTRDGIETASAWSAPKAESLLLGLASAAGQNAVLLEGVEGGLSIPLVAGSEPAYRISLAGGHCQP